MISRIDIRNFRCLRKVTVRLAPLTALVGSNASGKSAVLHRLVSPKTVVVPMDCWQFDRSLEVSLAIEFANGRWQEFRIKKEQVLDEDWRDYSTQLLRLDLSALRQPNQVERASVLAANGANLTNVFATLTRTQQTEVAKELSRLVPVVADVIAQPTIPGHHALKFQDRWNKNIWYDAAQVSDGTILLLAFLTLQFMDSPVDLVAIEEPERGLHPYLLGELIGFLRKLARGMIGKRSIQVVLATHSPELLDLLEPQEVRFLSREPRDGSVRVAEAPAQSPEWEKAFEEYRHSLGSAWLSGGLGGVPGG